jgi:hypothetical protein
MDHMASALFFFIWLQLCGLNCICSEKWIFKVCVLNCPWNSSVHGLLNDGFSIRGLPIVLMCVLLSCWVLSHLLAWQWPRYTEGSYSNGHVILKEVIECLQWELIVFDPQISAASLWPMCTWQNEGCKATLRVWDQLAANGADFHSDMHFEISVCRL